MKKRKNRDFQRFQLLRMFGDLLPITVPSCNHPQQKVHVTNPSCLIILVTLLEHARRGCSKAFAGMM